MRLKQLIKTILLLAIFTLFYWVASPAPVYAQACGGDCSVVICGYTPDPETGNPIAQYCSGCGGNGCESVGCPSGTYRAPDGSCHAIGGGASCECGVKPSGACKDCDSSAPPPSYPTASCPDGTVRTNNVISSACYDNDRVYAQPPGSAQAVGGCCLSRSTGGDCGDWYDCPTPNNPNKMCRDCTNAESYCVSTIINTYQCISVCNSTAPTNLSVTQGSNATIANVSWTAGSGGSLQKLYVDENINEVMNGCPTPNACEVNATLNTTTNSYIVTGLLPSTSYYFRVVTYESGTCSPSAVYSYSVPTISGQVYLDPDNTCSTSTPWTDAGVSVSLDGAVGNAISQTGSYAIAATQGVAHTLQLGIPVGYACSTGPGCNTCARSGIGSPSVNNNFFLADSPEAWWQTEGAGVYAGGDGGVRSILPSSSMRLILAGAGGSEALVMTNSGSVDVGLGSVSDSLWMATSKYKGKKMDYNYFAANMGVVRGQASNWSGSDEIDLNSYPVGSEFGYMKPFSGVATLSSPLNITASNKYVIFVDGDLEILANVTVETGGFLAFIVNGNVTVDPAVTALHGLFVIDESFITETQYAQGVSVDNQLDFQGTVVTWTTMQLGRSLGGDNSITPAEKFSYRVDLLTNMPDKMKTFALNWQEVAAGTFGE